ncbi:hypothetical protein BASA81_008347 [Batrachochytrium salamandrivorans]|nr:hypothetical protein BASA81_008347 [Batrachochytrium salamandrivorans]
MNRTLLNKATSADSSPTPGYLFDEIAKVTHDPTGNDRLVEYLLRRLESTNADVKFKVLNIIKQVCRKGNAAFRKSLQRDGATQIKLLLKFHCPPDALRGDEPSRKVREYAQEALTAIFDATKDERNLVDANLSNRIQGFGGQVAGSYPPQQQQQQHPSASFSAPPPPSSGRYQGIGNPAFAMSSQQDSSSSSSANMAAASAAAMLGKFTSVVKERFDRTPPAPPPLPTFSPPGGFPQQYQQQQSYPQQQQQQQPGGYSFQTNRMQQFQQQTYDPQESKRGSQPIQPQQQFGGSGSNGRAAAVEGYELQLIEELTSPIGIKPIPPKDKLEVFCSACRSTQVDYKQIVHRLNEKLDEGEEKVQRKTLAVIERMLSDPDLLDKFGDWFDAEIGSLEQLFQSPSSHVKTQVAKVWKLLYEEEEESSVVGATTSLLDFPQQQQQQQQQQQPAMMDMFQNLTVKSNAAATTTTVVSPAPPTSSSSFGFLSLPTPAAQPQYKPVNLLDQDNDLFSLMTPASTTQFSFPAPAPTAVAAASKKPTDSFGFVQDALQAAKHNY